MMFDEMGNAILDMPPEMFARMKSAKHSRMGSGASGSWGTAPENTAYAATSSDIPVVDALGNLFYPDGVVVDNMGNVYPPGSAAPSYVPAVAAAQNVANVASQAASNVGAGVTSILDTGKTILKWGIVGIVALALLEAMQFVPKGRR